MDIGKITKKNIKDKTIKYRYIPLFFIGFFFVVLGDYLRVYESPFAYLFYPLIMISWLISHPTEVLSIVLNHDYYYFGWAPEMPGDPIVWVYSIAGGIFFSYLITILTGKNEKIKKATLMILFIFYSINLIIHALQAFLFIYPVESVTIIADSSAPVITDLVLIITNLTILLYFNKRFRYLSTTLVKYIFTIIEIGLALFVGLALKDIYLSEGLDPFNLYLLPAWIIIMGFFLFVLLEMIKNTLLRRLKTNIKTNNENSKPL